MLGEDAGAVWPGDTPTATAARTFRRSYDGLCHGGISGLPRRDILVPASMTLRRGYAQRFFIRPQSARRSPPDLLAGGRQMEGPFSPKRKGRPERGISPQSRF